MHLLPTTMVGSYPQPDWLIRRDILTTRMPPRVRAREIWRVPEEFLEQAQDDATRLAVRDQEQAGLDIVTDGEIRRESYSNHFATALGGVDIDRPGYVIGRMGQKNPVPRVVGPIMRDHPIQRRDVEILRAATTRKIKITIPGPFTMSQQAQNEYYPDEEALAMAYAEAVRQEVADAFAAGADVVQLDEPWLQARPEQARQYGIAAINHALADTTGADGAGVTAVHLCFGYAAVVSNKPSGYSFLPELENCVADQISIEAAQPKLDLQVLDQLPSKAVIVGMIDLGNDSIESAEVVAERIRRALEVVPAKRLIIAPDCGMKYLPREVAFGKLKAMTAGAAIVRAEISPAAEN